jgi:alpha-tubulin suppressor-like RCC1 family protein
MPINYDHVQYSAIWTFDQVGAAVGQSLWPTWGPRLWSWGNDFYGSLALGHTTTYSSPKQVGALTNWSSVSTSQHTAIVKNNGTLWTWGYNKFGGQLGLGNINNYSSPIQVGAIVTWSQAICGLQSTIAFLNQ